MFVKIYQYHIQEDKVADYLELQEKTSTIYCKYIEHKSIYLQSQKDLTKWMEIAKYPDEKEYHKCLRLIHEEEEINLLYKKFCSYLVGDKQEVFEESFIERRVTGIY
ncbi:hypothetical protein LS684_16055 [Cytobacillus spongiae]|uniref:hypothetical protein n=1 Tax=Cytobacillus spongiae TaxID=2901381 RepID=UPI001F3E5575|nr:hypothetical protein [Cytobacillus spongiae]UII55157.1 hypothetical protein LS684_16055 [Cytobacillus spongiae]